MISRRLDPLCGLALFRDAPEQQLSVSEIRRFGKGSLLRTHTHSLLLLTPASSHLSALLLSLEYIVALLIVALLTQTSPPRLRDFLNASQTTDPFLQETHRAQLHTKLSSSLTLSIFFALLRSLERTHYEGLYVCCCCDGAPCIDCISGRRPHRYQGLQILLQD
jgi:hypothetical protein